MVDVVKSHEAEIPTNLSDVRDGKNFTIDDIQKLVSLFSILIEIDRKIKRKNNESKYN